MPGELNRKLWAQRRIQDFPEGGGNLKEAPTYYLAKFFRNLQENEENRIGVRASKILLSRSAMMGCGALRCVS